MATKSTGTRFVEYAAGSNVLPWVGWLENDSGETTGLVNLSGEIFLVTGEAHDTPHTLSQRNAVWNSVRDAALHAAKVPAEPWLIDYWPQSSIACLLSLVMKEISRDIGNAQEPQKDRMRSMLREVERLFFAAETFAPRPVSEVPPADTLVS